MAASKMAPLEPLGESGAEPLHRLFQIGLPGSCQKVVMVIHQHVGRNVNIKPLRHLTDSTSKNWCDPYRW